MRLCLESYNRVLHACKAHRALPPTATLAPSSVLYFARQSEPPPLELHTLSMLRNLVKMSETAAKRLKTSPPLIGTHK